MFSGHAVGLHLALPRWLAGAVAVAILGIVAVAASVYVLRSWNEGEDFVEVAAPPSVAESPPEQSAARQRRRTPRCDECGFVESTRLLPLAEGVANKVAGNTVAGNPVTGKTASGLRSTQPVDGAASPLRTMEIVVRLQDGSTRTITDVDSARWKRGERVKVIAGLAP